MGAWSVCLCVVAGAEPRRIRQLIQALPGSKRGARAQAAAPGAGVGAGAGPRDDGGGHRQPDAHLVLRQPRARRRPALQMRAGLGRPGEPCWCATRRAPAAARQRARRAAGWRVLKQIRSWCAAAARCRGMRRAAGRIIFVGSSRCEKDEDVCQCLGGRANRDKRPHSSTQNSCRGRRPRRRARQACWRSAGRTPAAGARPRWRRR